MATTHTSGDSNSAPCSDVPDALTRTQHRWAVTPYVDRIPHWQAKDVQLFPDKRNRWGLYGPAAVRADPWDMGWWRYRVPGLGQVDWARLVDRLYEGGYRGVVSVEHEDPVWGGTPDNVLTGLEVAERTLAPLLVTSAP